MAELKAMGLPADLPNVENALAHLGFSSVQLCSEDQAKALENVAACWRIELNAGQVKAQQVSYLLLVIEPAFPNSQPRVYAPELKIGDWPHVERQGRLCLKATPLDANIVSRLIEHIKDALELLNFDQVQCQAEFQREFASYWSQLTNSSEGALNVVLSLLKPAMGQRGIVCYRDQGRHLLLAAEDESTLCQWYENCTGIKLKRQQLFFGVLLPRSIPWCPDDFPKVIGEVLAELHDDKLQHLLRLDQPILFMYEIMTQTGPVFAAVLCPCVKVHKHRSLTPHYLLGANFNRVNFSFIKEQLKSFKAIRLSVERVDAAWIHGRDHSPDWQTLIQAKAVVIGCGSIGSGVIEQLAKAGIGSLVLVDSDHFSSANSSRHTLGMESLSYPKAIAIKNELNQRLPHLNIKSYSKRFEHLSDIERADLCDAAVVITAGIDIEGEAVFDDWRQTLAKPMPYISCWVEPYCLVGHAVLLCDAHRLMDRFRDNKPNFRYTDWSHQSGHVIVQAGCGNVFQPHGLVDLLPTIFMTSGLVLDVLLGRAFTSCRRVWFSRVEQVNNLGGNIIKDFDAENGIVQYGW